MSLFNFGLVLKDMARLTRQASHFNKPALIKSRASSSYEASGKTHFSFISKETDLLMIEAFSNLGFRLNNSMKCMGPIVIFPNMILSWNVENLRDIDENSLNIFRLIDPKPELVIVGYGTRFDVHNSTQVQKSGFKQAMRDISKVVLSMKKKGVSLEILPTEDALASYNYLCSENRLVGAALIPPSVIHPLRQEGGKYIADQSFWTNESSFIDEAKTVSKEPNDPRDDLRGINAAARRKQRKRPPSTDEEA